MEENKREIEKLFESVMADRGHGGWVLRWSPDGYCWRARKIIDLGPPEDLAASRQWLLHEIAHIEVVRDFGNQHVPEFFDLVEQLTRKYLGEELDEHQREMKEFYCSGSSRDRMVAS